MLVVKCTDLTSPHGPRLNSAPAERENGRPCICSGLFPLRKVLNPQGKRIPTFLHGNGSGVG